MNGSSNTNNPFGRSDSSFFATVTQSRIEEDEKGRPSKNGFKSEGKKMPVGRGMSFSFGVPTHSFLCLGNPGTRVPDRKAKVRFRSRGPT
jgi:hypothetical protein